MKIYGPVFNGDEFLNWVGELVDNGKTSGPNQTEVLIEFTALNYKRMERLYKTIVLQPDTLEQLNKIADYQYWYLITEAWCGDSAQILPVIAKMAATNDKIAFKVVLRDENPELIDKYLTNGGRSIPKLVSFDKDGNELFSWGPRPEAAQQIFLLWKADPQGKSWEDYERELHTWYAKDKTISTQAEIVAKL